MSTVRKRLLPSGKVRWLVDYRAAGARRFKQFETKAAAIAHETKVRGELAAGTHVADAASITVAKAAEIWLAACEANGLEDGTIRQYRNHVRRHIVPLLGDMKLSRLTAPAAQAFVDELAKVRNRATVAKVVTSLKSIVSEAMRRGLTAANPVLAARVPGSPRDERPAEFPTLDEIKRLLQRAEGPLIHTFILAGLRASELRGLTWEHVDLKDAMIRVRQRADHRLNVMGPPKSKAGRRDIPMGPQLLALLREWKVRQPVEQRVNGLVFPDAAGNVEDHTTLYRRFGALQLACGIAKVEDGERRPKFGLHALRHACASLLIAQRWQPKRIQTFMGHSSITLTYDVYGHLFGDAEGDQKAMTQLEQSLLG